MKLHVAQPRALSAVSVLCLVIAPYLRAQTVQPQPAGTNTGGAQPASAVSTGSSEEVVVLSPFVVDASEDQNSYKATSTLAGTRVRTDLKDVASAISVVTQQFLQDTGAKNQEDLLVYTPSTEVSGIRGNFSGVAGAGTYQENTISSTTRVRGLDTADNTRDYFLTDIPWDGFNVGRVDLQRGPNSILFGTGSPAGINNTSINDAAFKTAYTVENRLGQYGSIRDSIDLNQELVKGVLAIRVAAVKDNELYEQRPAYNNATRYYAALRFDPKLFSADSHTSIKVKIENGNVDSNNPRSIPPLDAISQWFNSGVDSLGHYGYNKIVVNQFNTAATTPWAGLAGFPLTMAAGKGGDLANGMALWNQTRSYWADIDNYYEDTPSNLNKVVNPAPYVSVGGAVGSATPTMQNGNPIMSIAAQPNTAIGIRDTGNNSAATAFPAFLPLTLPTYANWASTIGTYNLTDVPGGKNPVPGGNYYADKTLTDPSIFNFYKNLLDGPNKHEWQKWNAINVSLEQTFFDDRLGLLFVIDHQSYTNGTDGWLNSQNYGIFMDINATYANGALNPNVGRPYAGNAASAPGLNYSDTRTRNTFRFTPTYELRFEDLFGNTTLAKILGKSIFTGLYEDNNVRDDYYTFAEYATDPSWSLNNLVNNQTTVPATGGLGSGREFDWVAYLGPSLLNSSTAAGANLQRLNYTIAPPTTQTVLNFNATWNRPDPGWNALPSTFVKQGNGDFTFGTSGTPGYVDVPSGSIINLPNGQVLAQWNSTTGKPYYVNPVAPPAGYVDPGAPFSYTSFTNGTVQNTGQYNNASNYLGWISESVTWMKASDPKDFPSLVESASRTRYRDISDGFTYQGYFLNGDLVPTFGWRKDKITSYDTNGPSDPNTGFTSLNYPDDLSSRTDVTGRSKTWGGVFHLPKFLTSKLPGDTTISLFFDHSDNFKADASRLDLSGRTLPNSSGVTREYGFTINTLQDKLSLKVDWFRTTEANATLDSTSQNSIAGTGGNGYFLADGSIWGWAWATDVQLGLQGLTPNNSQYDSASADGLPKNTPAQIAAYNAYNTVGGSYTDANGGVHTYIGGYAIVNAWLNAPFPATFFSS